MKKTALIVSLILSALLLSGCDFFRYLAGRPTSADIAAKRQVLELVAAEKERMNRDSAAAVMAARKAAEDSVAVMSELAGTTMLSRSNRRFDAGTTASIDHRYYVVVGAFGEPANAAGMQKKLEEAGFKAVSLKYLGGFTAVAVNPSDRIADAYESLKRVTELAFVPEDSWILDTSAL